MLQDVCEVCFSMDRGQLMDARDRKSKKSKRESRGVHSRLLSFAVVVETSTLIHHPCNHVRLNTPGVKENAGEKHQELCFTLRLLR